MTVLLVTTAYRLTENNTRRIFPEIATGARIMQLPKRSAGETVGFDQGGDVALILDADGRTLASWTFDHWED